MIKLVAMTSIYLAVMGGLLFGAAGRLDWPMAWAYMVILTASTVALLVLGDREMLLVRAGKEKGAKTWDPFLANVSFLLFWPISCVVAGLDYGRLHFSPSIPMPSSYRSSIFTRARAYSGFATALLSRHTFAEPPFESCSTSGWLPRAFISSMLPLWGYRTMPSFLLGKADQENPPLPWPY